MPTHDAVAEDISILAADRRPSTRRINRWSFRRHEGRDGKQDTVRVSYHSMLSIDDEWLCPGHRGHAYDRFTAWWRQHASTPPPTSIEEFLARTEELRMPQIIGVAKDGVFTRVIDRIFRREDA